MEVNLLDILVMLSLAQGFIFGFVLLFSPIFKGSPNKYLALSFIMISIIGMNQWLSDWGFDDQYYFIDYFGDDVPWILLVFVPVLFFFLKITKHSWGNKREFLLLSIPFGIYVILNLIINFEYDFQWYKMPGMESFRYWVYSTESYLGPIYSLLLCIISFFIIRQAKVPPEEKIWIQRIWHFFLILVILWLIVSFIPSDFMLIDSAFTYGLWLAISFFIYWMTYKGLYQLRLVQDKALLKKLFHEEATEANKSSVIRTKEVVNNPTFDKNNHYLLELDRLLSEEKIFLDPDLSRDQVAERLGISSGYLSQIINTATSTNFTSYINQHRVEEVKKMILDPEAQKYSLLAIGLEAGFKSKSAFYTTFKKQTGKTPTEFKKSHR
ncbi:MAG: helix-turn-helix domain-containing protein [Bacteroidia bacterium]|nr:helix-turn-helix domain-containing protein [Bacteroidia bacterium]